jgi:hypothetical protein
MTFGDSFTEPFNLSIPFVVATADSRQIVTARSNCGGCSSVLPQPALDQCLRIFLSRYIPAGVLLIEKSEKFLEGGALICRTLP